MDRYSVYSQSDRYSVEIDIQYCFRTMHKLIALIINSRSCISRMLNTHFKRLKLQPISIVISPVQEFP